jgi:hypothetical protein
MVDDNLGDVESKTTYKTSVASNGNTIFSH